LITIIGISQEVVFAQIAEGPLVMQWLAICCVEDIPNFTRSG